MLFVSFSSPEFILACYLFPRTYPNLFSHLSTPTPSLPMLELCFQPYVLINTNS